MEKANSAVLKSSTRNAVYLIDAIGLLNIGFLCVCYVLWTNCFAEKHIQFSLLPFPIFVGEIAIFFNLVLLIIKFFLERPQFTPWFYVAFGYTTFVLLKAAYGYTEWGVLALRHAALFYCPVFVIFTFYFFRKEFFNEFVKIFLIVLLIGLIPRAEYWLFAFICLASILILSLKAVWLKIVLSIGLLLFSPFKEIFYVSRMMLLGNLTAIIFLLVAGAFIASFSRKVKSIIVAILLVALCFFVFNSINVSDAKSMIDFSRLYKAYSHYKNVIAKNEKNYKPVSIEQTQLYNPQDGAQKAVVYYPKQYTEYLQEKNSKASHSMINVITSVFSSVDRENVATITDHAIKSDEYSIALTSEVDTIRPDKEEGFIEKMEYGIFEQGITTAVFRLFIWEDMVKDYFSNNSLIGIFFGVDFGRPFLSRNIQVLGWAGTEWKRDGWIGAHNSFLEILYRAGLVGVAGLAILGWLVLTMIKSFIKRKSFKGILLCAVMISWIIAANFLLILELPYTAIPLWSILGISIAFCFSDQRQRGQYAKTLHRYYNHFIC